ncbi:alanine--tRNA ligase, mitochondrial [Diorhabda carinulata]|uniref:alanine--tRNA ligase, mitochondrial n=1 Tax=Diorhabda carinulata TaxID=1163345 RepID=UPI0025A28674|nr:alanine--tRNA ligase, mitochondrial [Diorhabda carinulata]
MVHMQQISQINVIPVLTTIYSSRSFSSYCNKQLSSKSIRKYFLDFFINENNHKYVKSSPVVPYCDPTVPFVNAGMNQFKGILLGTQEPKYKRVANCQKCIRVGGKHNDLNIVGTDGYHQTFFEMLGNWSFGDYFKPEACKLAWELITQVYKLPKKRLYVTYFKGDEKLGLKEDLETKELWKELGVSEDRILPFGVADNFWEMGLVGPCGPCTEIHYDHIGCDNRAEFVNKGLHDLIEIWNVVFIQYNRLPDGSIMQLPKQHVDTGMGFERMTSVLQGKISNYDTDNFKYLMDAITKNCRGVPKYESLFGEKDWNDLNKSYRMLADHSRMITVALADGVIPEENQKLRRIMRKVFILSETVFKKETGLLRELTNYIAENLESVYPEMKKNLSQIHQIINYEEEVYKNLRRSAAKDWQKCIQENPKLLELDIIEIHNFASAYRDITSSTIKEIDAKTAFRLYDTHGLDEENITKLAIGLNLKFDAKDFKDQLELVKLNSKKKNFTYQSDIYSYLSNDGVPKTNDSYKYSYRKLEDYGYLFETIQTRILKIFKDSQSIDRIRCHEKCSLVLNKTNFYTESGGQVSDKGKIYFHHGIFDVESVQNLNGYILHNGVYRSNSLNENDILKCNSIGKIEVDLPFRLNCMRNHTSVHLLNAALKKIKTATCQKSSKVTDSFLNLDVAIFGDKLSNDEIRRLEKDIVNVIKKGEDVNVYEIDSQDLLQMKNVTLIPGEIYPENGIRLVEINNDGFLSREPCCGTHVLNTSDIDDFCLTNIKSLGRSTTSLTAITGEKARRAKQNGAQLLEQIESFSKHVDDNMDKLPVLNKLLETLRKKLSSPEEPFMLPLIYKIECTAILDEINKRIQSVEAESLNDFIEIEMKNALDTGVKLTKNNKKYLIHYLRSSLILEKVPLQKATKLCPDYPVLVISYADNTVKARCCVPKNFKTEKFNAEKWMNETVATVFRSRVTPSRGQDGTLVCNMKAKRVHIQEWDPLLKASLQKAQEFVEKHL